MTVTNTNTEICEEIARYQTAQLEARRAALQQALDRAESGVYDMELSGSIYAQLVAIDARLQAMDMSNEQLLAGWPNGPASARDAIANERHNRGI